MLAVLVFLSTLFTKQHVLVDVAGGVILAQICFMLGQKTEAEFFAGAQNCIDQYYKKASY